MSSTWRSRGPSPISVGRPRRVTSSVRPLRCRLARRAASTRLRLASGSNGCGIELHRAGLELGEVEHVVDHAEQRRRWRRRSAARGAHRAPCRSRESCSRPAKPMIALSGVRSSWVMLARKSDLAPAPPWRPRRASISSCCSPLRSVITRVVDSMPSPPSASLRNVPSTQTSEPSRCMSRYSALLLSPPGVSEAVSAWMIGRSSGWALALRGRRIISSAVNPKALSAEGELYLRTPSAVHSEITSLWLSASRR